MTGSGSIVIIDSDQAYLDLMQEFLDDLGFHAVRWVGAAGAIDVVERHDPDLVILDSWLAGPADGRRLIDILHANPATRHIPIIVVTSDVSFRESEHNWALARAIIDKPFDLNELETNINSVLGTREIGTNDMTGPARLGSRMFRVVADADSSANCSLVD